MDAEVFDDALAGLSPERRIEARAVLDEMADARQARAMIDAHEMHLYARLASLADEQAAASANANARDYARRSFAAEAAIATCVAPGEARAQMELAERLDADCPETLAALREGEISLRHAEQVVRAGLNLDTGARASLDHHAAELAKRRTPRQLGVVLRKHAADIDSRSMREKHADARARRFVTVRAGEDGMGDMHIHAELFVLRAVHDYVDQMAREVKGDRARARVAFARIHGHLPEAGWTAPVSGAVDASDPLSVAATDQRTLAQLRVDLFTDLLLTARPTAHRLHIAGTGEALDAIRPSVQVTIPVEQMLDPDRGVAYTDAGELIPPDTARILAGNAEGWDRIFYRPSDGTIAAVDRYRPTAAQRRAVRARDMTCRVPGCEVPARRCDIDHGHDHARGGPTAVENLEALCPGHHQMKHQSGWSVRQVGGGVIEFTTPSGRVVSDEPMSRVFFHATPEAEAEEQRSLIAEHETERVHLLEQDRRDDVAEGRPADEELPGPEPIDEFVSGEQSHSGASLLEVFIGELLAGASRVPGLVDAFFGAGRARA